MESEVMSAAGGGAVSAIISIIYLAVMVACVASFWKVFTKAGKPGWASLVPIYNMVVLCEIGGKPPWHVLLMCIPIVNIFVVYQVSSGVAKAFGKDGGFALGLTFLSFVFYPILAFGSARYQGAPTGSPSPMQRAA